MFDPSIGPDGLPYAGAIDSQPSSTDPDESAERMPAGLQVILNALASSQGAMSASATEGDPGHAATPSWEHPVYAEALQREQLSPFLSHLNGMVQAHLYPVRLLYRHARYLKLTPHQVAHAMPSTPRSGISTPNLSPTCSGAEGSLPSSPSAVTPFAHGAGLSPIVGVADTGTPSADVLPFSSQRAYSGTFDSLATHTPGCSNMLGPLDAEVLAQYHQFAQDRQAQELVHLLGLSAHDVSLFCY